MGSHSVTCHLIEVNAPRLNPSQIRRYSIYLPWRDGRLSWPKWLVTYRDGLPANRQWPHRSTNQAQCTVTSLIGSDTLPLHHATKISHNIILQQHLESDQVPEVPTMLGLCRRPLLLMMHHRWLLSQKHRNSVLPTPALCPATFSWPCQTDLQPNILHVVLQSTLAFLNLCSFIAKDERGKRHPHIILCTHPKFQLQICSRYKNIICQEKCNLSSPSLI